MYPLTSLPKNNTQIVHKIVYEISTKYDKYCTGSKPLWYTNHFRIIIRKEKLKYSVS